MLAPRSTRCGVVGIDEDRIGLAEKVVNCAATGASQRVPRNAVMFVRARADRTDFVGLKRPPHAAMRAPSRVAGSLQSKFVVSR